MPLARIEIEQVEGTRWVAEVEAGDFAHFKRHRVTGRSYAEIRAAVDEIMQPVESAAVERDVAAVSPVAADTPAADVELPASPRRGRPPRNAE